MIKTVTPAINARQAANTVRLHPGLHLLKVAGSFTVLAYACYFVLMQSHSLWQAPTLVQDRWKQIFYPVSQLFPISWLRPRWDSPLKLVNAALYLVLLFALFALYLWAMKRVFRAGVLRKEDAGGALKLVVGITLVALLVLLIVPGVLSTDLFSYVWYGRIVGVFGDNPFTHVPADYTWRDPGNWLQWVYWKETPSVYGPAWVMLAGVVASAAQAFGGDIVNHVLGHKILADLSHIANVLLIWKVADLVISRYWPRPDSLPHGVSLGDWQTGARVGVTLAYAWNPLLILETGANGHNDVLLVTGVLAALWLHLLGRWRLASVALAIATLVKFNTVLLLPGYLWLLVWESGDSRPSTDARRLLNIPVRGLWTAAQSILLIALTFALFYLPFWVGPATFKPITSGPFTEQYVNSLGALIKYKLPEGMSALAAAFGWHPHSMWTVEAISSRLDWPARWGSMLIFTVFAVMQTWRARTFPRMLAAWGWVMFVYLTVGAVWFWPWYVVWLVPVAALAGPGRLLKSTYILCMSSMLLYAAAWRGTLEFKEWADYVPLLMIGPPLVYAVVSWLIEARRRAATTRVAARRPAFHAAGQTHAQLIPAQVRTDTRERQ